MWRRRGKINDQKNPWLATTQRLRRRYIPEKVPSPFNLSELSSPQRGEVGRGEDRIGFAGSGSGLTKLSPSLTPPGEGTSGKLPLTCFSFPSSSLGMQCWAKLQLCIRRSWSFSTHHVPKLELGNEAKVDDRGGEAKSPLSPCGRGLGRGETPRVLASPRCSF